MFGNLSGYENVGAESRSGAYSKRKKYMKDVVIVAGVRTPVGAFGGSFQSMAVVQLGAITLKAALRKAGLRPVANEAMIRVEPDAISGFGTAVGYCMGGSLTTIAILSGEISAVS
ncbi:MAG: hypothetical protein P4L42_12575 [Desulfocapsaceae bacterium]|nr:hypothetical protein [Desulfocapsaceae bacterium]